MDAIKSDEQKINTSAADLDVGHDHDATMKEMHDHDAMTDSDDSETSVVDDVLDLIEHCEQYTEHVNAGQPPQVDTSGLPDAAGLGKDLKHLGPQSFLEKYLIDQENSIRGLLGAFGVILPPELDDLQDVELIQILRIYISREFNKREKLSGLNGIEDVVRLLQSSSNILVITGAGISTSLGIPDFRSANGIYSRLEKYNLTDPQEMFDIHLFRHDPSIFFDFAKELLPEDRGYSPTHAFIRLLQDKGKLLRQYTQNIDNIESTAGVTEERLVQCHGSFRMATCLTCGHEVPGESLFPEIKMGKVPKCQICHAAQLQTLSRQKKTKDAWKDDDDDDDAEEDTNFGILKPNITFFGEQLQSSFKETIMQDRSVCDLTLCIGTSLRVAPVAEIPNLVPAHVPQIFINRDPAHSEMTFDLELLGDNDQLSTQLADACGWGHEFNELVKQGKLAS